ncbi:hypothetical protein BLOT_006528 [Blomia tropicalis]|nr:hypothetical protein BLOT_006528 [Blomia tropicalis]
MNSSDNYYVMRSQCASDFGKSALLEFLQMFYIVFPENYDKPPIEMPNYELNLIPTIMALTFFEQIARLFQRQKLTRVQDVVTNVGSSIIFTFSRVLFLGVMIHVYTFIYDNYRIIDLPLYSVWTWLFSLLLVEFVYYWTHRALHEFNILWAAHQFHHMAEDLNITTTIRDSVVDLIIYDIFPVPISFLIQPQILVVHMQFSLIYQIWLHNSVVGDLGFIEYIVNTPRQHLVHHGKNPYCIDKNYGALLMIWDRMFGTYQREKKDDELVFGVVSPTPATFDPMVLQFGYYRDVYKKFCQMETFSDKMSALFKGPGWSPGKPRLGLISDVPEPDRSAPKYSYDPKTSVWIKLYVAIHGIMFPFVLYMIGHHTLIRFSYGRAFILMIKYAHLFEILRCILYFPVDYYIAINTAWQFGSGEKLVFDSFMLVIRTLYITSILIWILKMLIKSNPHGSMRRKLSNVKMANVKLIFNENIELAKKLASKTARKIGGFKVLNITVTAIYIIFVACLIGILYFLKVESCTSLLNTV